MVSLLTPSCIAVLANKGIIPNVAADKQAYIIPRIFSILLFLALQN